MKKISITPQKYASIIATTDFKKWILKEYKHAWHTLSNSQLYEALEAYNIIAKLKAFKFWD